jgi:hypothetical protein
MSRKLKVLGTTLVAVVAFGVVMASAAQAKFDTITTFPTSEETAILTGEADPAGGGKQQFFTAGGVEVSCTGIKIEEATIKDKDTTITAHPVYTGCKIAEVVNTTVTTTGCNYLFTSETTTNTTSAKEDATVHVECEAGKKIKIGPTLGCEVTVGEQTLHGVHYNNATPEGTPTEREMHITLEATAMNIAYETKGCASLLSEADGAHAGAEYKGNTTVKGFKDENKIENPNVRVGITVDTFSTEVMP